MNNIHVLNLAEYQQPTIQESKRDNWVEFGEDNNYFGYLIERYTKSTTNSAIINKMLEVSKHISEHNSEVIKHNASYFPRCLSIAQAPRY